MEKEKLVIIGAGGLGREILFLLSDINSRNNRFDILGFIDDTPELQNKIVNDTPILGDSSWLLSYSKNINVVIAVGSSQGRKNIYEKTYITHSFSTAFTRCLRQKRFAKNRGFMV